MRNRIIHLGLTLIITICLNNIIIAQITRGAQPGEIYLSGHWYINNVGQVHYGIFRSGDNGENISLQYENIEIPPPNEMKVGKVLGDANNGALYNYGFNELWVSFDYGESWEYKETYGSSGRFTSGCVNGEIYKCCVNPQGTIWQSTDYGDDFFETTENAKYPLEVGVLEGDVYGMNGHAGSGYDLHFSNNFTVTFDTIPIDSAVAFWAPGGYYPQISRGTEPGELYLVSWWPDYHYKIFHSADTGYTWTEKFESGYIDIYYWGVTYTAGREPGSFYVKRATPVPSGDHTWLYIDYSNDYGETFTTYFHDLDSTITGFRSFELDIIKLSNYPNPFIGFTTFSFNIPANIKNPKLNIYNVYGKQVRQINISGKKTQIWDGTDSNGKKVKDGFYLYNINYDNFNSQFNKLLIVN